MLNKKRVLVVSHEASYTGAPILLLHLLHLLKQTERYEYSVLIAKSGPLKDAFNAIGKVTVLKPADYSQRSMLGKLFPMVMSRLILIRKLFEASSSCDFIFVNSITNGFSVRCLAFSGKPMLTYVHELATVTELFSFENDIKPVLKHTHLFLYPCSAVANYLNWLNPNYKVLPLNYYFPNNQNISSRIRFQQRGDKLRVVGVGTASPRKGTDLFIETAAKVFAQRTDVSFYWVGGFASPELEKCYRKQVEDLGISSVFEFSGQIPPDEARLLYNKFDLLFLSSREDPYPLVVLEAAAMECPSIVFEGAGGITSFVDNSTGFIAIDFNTDQVGAIISAMDKSILQEKGLCAKERVHALHFNPDFILRQFEDAVAQLTNH